MNDLARQLVTMAGPMCRFRIQIDGSLSFSIAIKLGEVLTGCLGREIAELLRVPENRVGWKKLGKAVEQDGVGKV